MLRTKRGRCEAPGLRPWRITPHLTSQTLLSLRLWVSNAQWLAHMLNSLVRVSRRVGGTADLLATEMRTVPARALSIRDRSTTRPRQSQERGAWSPKAANFTHALGPSETVRRVWRQRSAGADRANKRTGSLRIPRPQAAPTSPWTVTADFESPSVYY